MVGTFTTDSGAATFLDPGLNARIDYIDNDAINDHRVVLIIGDPAVNCTFEWDAGGGTCGGSYQDDVLTHDPLVYWRLGDATKTDGSPAANLGSLGAAGNGTYKDTVGDVLDVGIGAG